MGDLILLRDVELPLRIGVPDEERANWQSLTADVTLTLRVGFDEMQDELGATVDYDAVSKQLKALAAERPRQLLEILAAEMVQMLLQNDLVLGAEVELRKRALPGVRHAAVKMKRMRSRFSKARIACAPVRAHVCLGLCPPAPAGAQANV